MFKKYKEVMIKDSTFPLFQYYAMQILRDDITLTSIVNINDTIINVSSGHEIIVGEHLVLWGNSIFEQLEVINVNVNQITISHPITNSYSLNTKVIRGRTNLNINAESSPVDIIFRLYNSIIPIYLYKIIINLQHGILVPDDGKFGGITELNKGIYIREVNEGIKDFGLYRKNQDFKDRGGEIEYSQKAPAGSYATTITFDIKNIFGQAIEINPKIDQYIIARLQDDFGDLDRFVISLIGKFRLE